MSTHQQSSSLTIRVSWLAFAKTLTFVFGVALPLLLVRELSQQEFGTYKQLFLFAQTALGVPSSGFGLCAFYFAQRRPDRHAHFVLNVVLFYGVVGGLFCLRLAFNPALLPGRFNDATMRQYAPQLGRL